MLGMDVSNFAGAYRLQFPGRAPEITTFVTAVPADNMLFDDLIRAFYGEHVDVEDFRVSRHVRLVFLKSNGRYSVVPDTPFNRQFWEKVT